MAKNKVEITGINTNDIVIFTSEETDMPFQYHSTSLEFIFNCNSENPIYFF